MRLLRVKADEGVVCLIPVLRIVVTVVIAAATNAGDATVAGAVTGAGDVTVAGAANVG